VFLDVANISGGYLVAWSDSCSGQNKNFYILSVWQYLIKTTRFNRIEHKFPVPGHSFMDSDRDFAHIEAEVRKHENIYTVDSYRDIMATSMRSSKPRITAMHGHFVNIKVLPKTLKLNNKNVTVDGTHVPLRDGVCWLVLDTFGQYKFRESFSEGEPWKVVKLTNTDHSRNAENDAESHVELEHLLPVNLPIKKANGMTLQNKWHLFHLC